MLITLASQTQIESFKKACIRLSEIAKEDNKGHFKISYEKNYHNLSFYGERYLQ
jgi:hypothetical protein